MSAAVLQRLRRGASLEPADETYVRGRLAESSWLEAQDRVSDGRVREAAVVVHEGMVQVYRILGEGGRLTTALLLPGDLVAFRLQELRSLKLEVEAVARSRVSILAFDALRTWARVSPTLERAIDHLQSVDEAIAREWLVSLGARPTLGRVAHLLCELRWRLRATVPGDPDAFDLPLNQMQLGQTLGVSAVHINRVLAHLRADGLASFRGGRVAIHDRGRLEALAGFNDFYLRLGAPRASGAE